MKCGIRVSVAEHLSPYSLHSMIKVSAELPEPWRAILYLITLYQYPPRLGVLFYILSRLDSIRRGLACHSISYHALAVSTEAWRASLYLITPWHYPPRLGVLAYILSRLGSIRQGLACHSISYHALAASAERPTFKTQATKAQVERTIQDCKSPSSKNPSYESSS